MWGRRSDPLSTARRGFSQRPGDAHAGSAAVVGGHLADHGDGALDLALEEVDGGLLGAGGLDDLAGGALDTLDDGGHVEPPLSERPRDALDGADRGLDV